MAVVQSSQMQSHVTGLNVVKRKQCFPPDHMDPTEVDELRSSIACAKQMPKHAAGMRIVLMIKPYAGKFTRASLMKELNLTHWQVAAAREHTAQYGLLAVNSKQNAGKAVRRTRTAH